MQTAPGRQSAWGDANRILSLGLLSLAISPLRSTASLPSRAAPFLIRVETAEGPREYLARAVIDATGTWSLPNPLGANGIAALGEAALATPIDYGMPDVLGAACECFAGRQILVVGAGHSAAGTLLALAHLLQDHPGTSIVWATRGSQLARVFGGGEADGLGSQE